MARASAKNNGNSSNSNNNTVVTKQKEKPLSPLMGRVGGKAASRRRDEDGEKQERGSLAEITRNYATTRRRVVWGAPLWGVGLGLGLGFGRSFVWQPGGGPPRRGDNNEEGGRGRDAGNNTGRGNDDDESSADRRGTTSVHVGIGGGLFGGFGGLF